MQVSQIREIHHYEVVEYEQLGTKDKFWIDSGDGGYVLFKRGRANSGEHWAEVITAQIAGLLGIPHADYFFARFNKKLGVVTPSIVQSHSSARLIHGNELLSQVEARYPATRKDPGFSYNLENIHRAIRHYQTTTDE